MIQKHKKETLHSELLVVSFDVSERNKIKIKNKKATNNNNGELQTKCSNIRGKALNDEGMNTCDHYKNTKYM